MFAKNKKYQQKLLVLFFIMIIFTPLLNGCWNYRDLEQLSIVSGIGLDLDEKGKIALSAQIINTSALKTGESGSGSADPNEMVRVSTSSGDTVFQALRNFIPQASRRLYLAHMQILVIGEEGAKKGIYPLLDLFVQDHESRPGIYLLISHEKAADVLRSDNGLESIPAIGISRAIETGARNGFIPDVNLQDFSNLLMSPTTAPVAPHIEIYEEKGFNNKITQRVRTLGTVVFRQDKMIGVLGLKETRGLCWVLGKVQSGIVTFHAKGVTSSFEVIKSTTKINGYLQQGQPLISVHVHAEGNFGEQQGNVPLTSEEIPLLQKVISREIKKEISDAVAKAQDLKSDIFGFGEVMHRAYPKEWKEMEP
ncbi:MAG: Ger(x)C family spore germination protein, partial [Dehalobacterium sp.]